MSARVVGPFASALLWSLACGGSHSPDAGSSPERASIPAEPEAVECASTPIDVSVAPGTRPEHRSVEHWLARLSPGQADEVLVPAADIGVLNARFSEVDGAWRDPLDPSLADPAAVAGELEQRMAWLRSRVADGRLLEGHAGDFEQAEHITRTAEPADTVHLVVDEASVWCAALDTGLYKPPVDLDFDRNRCASLHPGEVVRVLARGLEGRWFYVHSGHTTGWLHDPVLTPALSATDLRPWLEGPVLRSADDGLRSDGGRRLRLGTRVPVVGRDGARRRVLIPTADGLVEDTIAQAADVAVDGALPLTRRHLWRLALAQQDTPYGWGGTGGNRDCSRLMRDVMATFGLELARHSGVQAKLGTHRVDVSGMSEADKSAALRRWAQRGAVLLYMPGHIMLYLGEEGGQHYAVSAISEYLEPCVGGPDTVFRIGRVAVTTLELGRGTERTAYIERLATLVVFGPGGG